MFCVCQKWNKSIALWVFLVFSYVLGGCDYVQSSPNSICYCFVLQIFNCLSRFQLVANFSANLRFVLVPTRPPASQPGSFVNAFRDGFASDLLIFGFLGWRRIYIVVPSSCALCVFQGKKENLLNSGSLGPRMSSPSFRRR